MASPFAAQLGTNYSPKDEELLEIKSLLIEPTRRLKILDDKITELRNAINKLVEERDGLEAYVNVHKALLAPVRRLPLDIIEEIFVACLPTHRNCVMNASEAPVLLGRICSSWRAISLSTPRLWAKIHVVEPPSDPFNPPTAPFSEKVTQLLEITKMWLGRSGQCPLSISLQSAAENTPFGIDVSPTASVQFLQAVILFAPRWQHIHFTTPPSYILEIISRLDTDMPWLETIAFHYHHHRPLDSIDWGHFNMVRGARISSVSIPGSIFIPERFPVLWGQLTTLTIGGPIWTVSPRLTSATILRVISGCPELRCCKLVVNDSDTETPMLRHPIVELPFLHTFAVHCATQADLAVSVLLKHLYSPKLRNFTFLGSSQESTTLGDFVARSLCMENFEIGNNAFSKASCLDTLRHLPSTVRQLRIRATEGGWGPPACFDDDTLAVLASPGLCPALQGLSIDHGFHDISDAAVLQFIAARMLEPRTDLKSVNIYFGRPMTLDIMPSLRAFMETGLAISLVYPPPMALQYSPWNGLPDAPPATLSPPSLDW